jgi:hypothetical protein
MQMYSLFFEAPLLNLFPIELWSIFLLLIFLVFSRPDKFVVLLETFSIGLKLIGYPFSIQLTKLFKINLPVILWLNKFARYLMIDFINLV